MKIGVKVFEMKNVGMNLVRNLKVVFDVVIGYLDFKVCCLLCWWIDLWNMV